MKNDMMLPKTDLSVAPEIIRQMMGPLVEAMAKLLENNTQALNQLSQAQQVQNDRLEALERQIRLNTPVTRAQARYIAGCCRERAKDLLDKSGAATAWSVRKLTGVIKKDVLAIYGVTAMEEIPRHEYQVAMNSAKTWNSLRLLRETVKEARRRVQEDGGGAEQIAGMDGEKAGPGVDDQ